ITYSGFLSFGSGSCLSRSDGSRSCHSVGCESSGFRSLNDGVPGFLSISYMSNGTYSIWLFVLTPFLCCLPSSSSSSGSSCPSNLAYSTTSCSPSTCQLHSGCQETCIEPTSCQRSCVVSSPCQMPCYYPRSSTPCSPSQRTYAGCLSCGSSNFHSLGYGSRSCSSADCGSRGFKSLNYEVPVFPSLSNVFTFCYPTYLLFITYQPSFCVPT
ncbi:hypothetical protein A6R68_24198, partial [Neotoma lepida]